MELANEAELSEPLRMGQELPVLRFRLFDGCGNVFALHGKSMSVHNVIVLGEGTLDVSAAKAKVRQRIALFCDAVAFTRSPISMPNACLLCPCICMR
eukprot:3411101-Rhodomonas_salina.6